MVRGQVWKVKDDILRVTSSSQTAPAENHSREFGRSADVLFISQTV